MIPADHITFNGDGTAWWVVPGSDAPGVLPWHGYDRPCDTCGGNWQDYMEPLDVNGNVVSPCPDCIDGRHTFEIEVADERRPWPEHHKTYRVSIVPGMVLGIYDPTTRCPGPASPHICWSAEDRHVESDTDGCWLLVTNTLHDASPAIILPPASEPGMWAVQLKVVSQ